MCTIRGVTAAEAGAAIAESGDKMAARTLLATFMQEVWDAGFKARLASGQGGQTRWHVEHFLSSTEGIDDVILRGDANGCRVEIGSQVKDNVLLPAPFYHRDVLRERSILLWAYWQLKEKIPHAAAYSSDPWRPSDPPRIELREGALWAAARDLPLEAAVAYLVASGFKIESRSAAGDRIELQGRFTERDPFGVHFRTGTFGKIESVELWEKAVIKKRGDTVVIGLWVQGTGSVSREVSVARADRIVISSADNQTVLREMLFRLGLQYNMVPLSPEPFAENITPPTAPTQPATAPATTPVE